MNDYIETSPWIAPVLAERLHLAIEVVQDFPKPGILFRNVLPALGQPLLLDHLISAMIGPYCGIDRSRLKVVGLESRGFIFAAAMASSLGVGFVAARKAEQQPDGSYRCKLPGNFSTASYDLEYGRAALAMQHGSFRDGDKAIIVDDLLATGGTASAAAALVRGQGAEVISHDFVIELAALSGRKRLLPQAIANSPTAGFHALLTY